LYGPPGVRDFDSVDDEARDLARSVDVQTDSSLLESEAVLLGPDGFEARIEAALGSPACPMTASQLASKVEDLAGDSLYGILDNPHEGAKALVEAAHLQ
jgi:hypothetical protein